MSNRQPGVRPGSDRRYAQPLGRSALPLRWCGAQRADPIGALMVSAQTWARYEDVEQCALSLIQLEIGARPIPPNTNSCAWKTFSD